VVQRARTFRIVCCFAPPSSITALRRATWLRVRRRGDKEELSRDYLGRLRFGKFSPRRETLPRISASSYGRTFHSRRAAAWVTVTWGAGGLPEFPAFHRCVKRSTRAGASPIRGYQNDTHRGNFDRLVAGGLEWNREICPTHLRETGRHAPCTRTITGSRTVSQIRSSTWSINGEHQGRVLGGEVRHHLARKQSEMRGTCDWFFEQRFTVKVSILGDGNMNLLLDRQPPIRPKHLPIRLVARPMPDSTSILNAGAAPINYDILPDIEGSPVAGRYEPRPARAGWIWGVRFCNAPRQKVPPKCLSYKPDHGSDY